jgi:hypothetical protein
VSHVFLHAVNQAAIYRKSAAIDAGAASYNATLPNLP